MCRYTLNNGVKLPWIAFGTGVVWRYSRNPYLFLKWLARCVLSSARHLCPDRELMGNLRMDRILREAYGNGYRMFDTGRIYGYSEKKLGKLRTRGSGGDFCIITKCSEMDLARKGTPDTVKGNLDLSLSNLKSHYVDVYLLHWPEGNWLGSYKQLVSLYGDGAVKSYGCCNVGIGHLTQIEESKLPLPMVIQTELHPLNGNCRLRAYCREHGIQLMAHTPTGRMGREIRECRVLQDLSAKYHKSIAQIILRWHFQNGIIPVVSSFKTSHMRENLDIFDFELSQGEMEEIDGLDQGLRYLNTEGIDDPNYIYNL